MTKLEQNIYDCVEANNGKLSAYQIAEKLMINEKHGNYGKQVVGMAIGRMIKKGVNIEYNWDGYRVEAKG